MTWMICLFGGIGAMARYVLDVSIQRSWNRDGNHSFPLATLVINGVASLCAGITSMCRRLFDCVNVFPSSEN